jgi:hypothetical protein
VNPPARHLLPLCLVLTLAAPPLSAATTIYKRELPDGTVIYSDQPHPDAQVLNPSAPQTIDPYRPSPRASGPSGSAPSAPATVAYERVAITSPADEESVWNDDRLVQVSVAVEPALRRGHRIAVLFDGERVAETDGAGTLRLHNVFRGSHSLEAVVEDQSGRIIARGTPVTFHMKQHSILNPPR